MKQAAKNATPPSAQPPVNLLIAEHPGDTLSRCAHVAAFLQEAARVMDLSEDPMTIGEGVQWTFMLLTDALEWEAKRVLARRAPEIEVAS